LERKGSPGRAGEGVDDRELPLERLGERRAGDGDEWVLLVAESEGRELEMGAVVEVLRGPMAGVVQPLRYRPPHITEALREL
jgi:hypothetical protein